MDAFRKAVFNQSEMQTQFGGTKRFRRRHQQYAQPYTQQASLSVRAVAR